MRTPPWNTSEYFCFFIDQRCCAEYNQIKNVLKTAMTRNASWPLRRAISGLLGILLALVLAYLAQGFYDGAAAANLVREWVAGAWSTGGHDVVRLAIGSGLYLAAALVFAWAAPKPPAYWWPQPRIVPADRLKWAPVRAVLLAVSLALAGVAALRFVQLGEDRLVQIAWVSSLLLFLVSQAPVPARRAWSGLPARLRGVPAATWWTLLALVAIMAVAAWLRLTHLDTLPADLHGDMASYGLQARDYLSGREWRIFREGWANIPIVGYFPTIASMAVFGDNLFGLNMGAALGGLISLLGFFFLIWRLFGRPGLALLATAILTITIPHIHFSRIAAYIDPWPWSLWAIFFLLDGLLARRAFSFALAGVLLAFGGQMYYAGRVVFFVLALFAVYLVLFHRAWLAGRGRGLALFAVGFLVAVGPTAIYFAQHVDVFMERSRVVFLFYPDVMTHLMGKYQVDSTLKVVLEQTWRSLLMYHYGPDSSTQFGYPHPMFGSWISPLIVLGLGYAVRWWRVPGATFWTIFWGLNLVIGGILTGDAPAWMRLVGMTFAGAFFAGLGLHRVAAAGLARARPSHPVDTPAVTSTTTTGGPGLVATPRFQIALFTISAAFLVFLIVGGWQDWTEYTRLAGDNGRPQALIGRYLASLPPTIAACDISIPYDVQIRETAFLAAPRLLIDLPSDPTAADLARCPGPPFVWILGPGQWSQLNQLRRIWPDGVETQHQLTNGASIFMSYLVTEPNDSRTRSPATPAAPTAIAQPGLNSYLPDGSPFAPADSFLGDTRSATWEIPVGRVTIENGRLVLQIGQIPGHDAVYDYVRLVGANGLDLRIEAEDAQFTQGDAPTSTLAVDGHWWRQTFGVFSGSQALVAQKQESVPVLTTTIEAPNGEYELLIGSFSGDPNNGVFGLGVTVGLR